MLIIIEFKYRLMVKLIKYIFFFYKIKYKCTSIYLFNSRNYLGDEGILKFS